MKRDFLLHCASIVDMQKNVRILAIAFVIVKKNSSLSHYLDVFPLQLIDFGIWLITRQRDISWILSKQEGGQKIGRGA